MAPSPLGLLVLVALAAAPVWAANSSQQDLGQVEWWKKTNFYHIYLRSFKDSNGDGNGDLRGVIEQLDYLSMAGVETILMAPFYSSPMKDGGYDISDYLDIEPMFGTMADFERLVEELHKRRMRIVVDFVPNHSSNKHHWFQCSERALLEPERCGKYRDYYVWTDSRRHLGKYPSNWISVFGGGPAWSWSDVRKQFYLHQFLPEQPDLNFTNEAVREEFKEVARFWLRKGADGLRVDSAIYLIENTADGFPDEPANPSWREGDDPADRLLHVHTRSLHASAEIVSDWRQVAEEAEFSAGPGADRRIIITEAYADIPALIEYYGSSPRHKLADLPFNFELFKLRQDNLEADHIERVLMNWIAPTRALAWPDEQGAMSPWIIWVTGNHDNPRLTNRVGRHNVAFIRWLTYLVPGSPVNYYGDELPLHDANFNSISQKTIDEGEPSRLPERAPMAWRPVEPSAGFSSSADTWMPLNADWRQRNVESLLSPGSEPKNELKQFLKLQQLRAEHLNTLVFGDLVFFRNQAAGAAGSMVFGMARTHAHFGSLLLLANLDPQNELVLRLTGSESVLGRARLRPPAKAKVLMTSYTDSALAPEVRDGAEVALEGLVLARSQAVILRYDD